MKLNAIHLIDQGSYLVDRSWSLELEVDGIPIPSGSSQIVAQSLDRILVVTRRQGEVLTYRDAEGATITAADHAQQKTALLEGVTTDDGDRLFPSLDAEFAYRKFEARWKVGERAPDVVTKLPAEVQITEVRTSSGDPDIVSLWNAPHVKRDATLYSFDRDSFMVRLCKTLCADSGLALDMKMTSSGEWDYLRFAKIDGEYAFGDTFDKCKGTFISTLAECAAEKERCRERVASIVRVHAIKKADQPLLNAGDVILGLRDVHRRLSSLSVKGSGTNDLGYARKRLTDLITAIETDLVSTTATTKD